MKILGIVLAVMLVTTFAAPTMLPWLEVVGLLALIGVWLWAAAKGFRQIGGGGDRGI